MKQGFASRWLASLPAEELTRLAANSATIARADAARAEAARAASVRAAAEGATAQAAMVAVARARPPVLPPTAASTAAVLVLARTEAELVDFVRRNPHTEREVTLVPLANPGKRHGSYAVVANKFISERKEDVVGIIHCDTTFAAGALRELAIASLRDGGQITGMVGRALTGAYVWSRDGGGIISTLDCCSIFFPRAIGLRFDEKTFDDFHCMVEDICLQGAVAGVRAFVPRTGLADHHGWGVYNDPKWLGNHAKYRRLLAAKWPGRRFITTCD